MDKITTDNVRLTAEPSRVVIRPFHLSQDPLALANGDGTRVQRIVKAVLAMGADEVSRILDAVNTDFATRHWQSRQVHLARFEKLREELDGVADALSQEQRELIGAYFCHEYSYSAAAVMNPSIVPHPDQSGLREGDQRFLMSVRSVGEGHISSVSFREGILKEDGDLQLWPQPDLTISAHALSIDGDVVQARRPSTVPISGLVIFPFTPAQRNGLEDLRLVRFEERDGSVVYHGTYTAYSGAAIRSELLTTRDFMHFTLQPMKGRAAQAKGLALFPRKIDGRFCMIGRQDGESCYFLESEDLITWEGGVRILKPKYPWELVQIGNCGSPIELEEGWLLLTHGVGAMRKYAIGAALLDKRDPSKVLGRLANPLLAPSGETREGYVPNVLYTCGGLKHGDSLFVPFGIADSSISFAMVDLKALLGEMV